jgi:hypothetical protein
MAIGELVTFVIVAAASTWLFEGTLLREAVGYLARRAVVRSPAVG